MPNMRIYLLCLFPLINPLAFATGYQIFPTLAYDNPATLNTTSKMSAILGATDIGVGMKYSGSVGNNIGTAESNTNIVLPYLRLAYRIDPKWVTSFDISHPLLSNITFPSTSIVSPVAIDDIIIDTNYSPKASYQMTDKLAIGFGFDANQVSDAQVNFGGPPLGKMTNKTSGWNYGWDAGLAFQINQSNFLNANYYSEINFSNLTGYSQQGNVKHANFSDNLVVPATWTLNLVHKPTSLWTVVETCRYIQWSAEKNLALVNSAGGNIIFPLNYNDSWSAQLATRYQVSEKWGVGIAAEYDSSPQSTAFRPIALPATSITLLGTSLDYALTSEWSAKLQYAYIFANPEINQAGPTPQLGHVNIGVNIVDLGIAWKI